MCTAGTAVPWHDDESEPRQDLLVAFRAQLEPRCRLTGHTFQAIDDKLEAGADVLSRNSDRGFACSLNLSKLLHLRLLDEATPEACQKARRRHAQLRKQLDGLVRARTDMIASGSRTWPMHSAKAEVCNQSQIVLACLRPYTRCPGE